MKKWRSLALFVALVGGGTLALAQTEFMGKWQTTINPARGKHLFTVNMDSAEGTIKGTMILVDPVNGNEIKSEITDVELSGKVLKFKTRVHNDTFDWRLTVDKDNRKGLLHGSMHEMVIDEQVFKQH